MKITTTQLKTIVRNALNEQRSPYGDLYSHKGAKPTDFHSPNNRLIGEIRASIGGDSHYSQKLSVFYHPSDDTITIEMTSTGQEGGRDSMYGASPASVIGKVKLGAGTTSRDLVSHVRQMIDSGGDIIAQYGRPSKNFTWGLDVHRNGGQKGLSARAAQYALDSARDR